MVSIRHAAAGDTPPHRPDRRPSSPAAEGDLPDAVLGAARESILAVGWRRTTLTDVARRAGVSRMTIYRRWPDMRTLLADLLVREWAAMLATTPVAAEGEVSAGGLAGSVVAVVRALRVDPLFARIVEVDPELLLPYLLERRGRNQDRMIELLSEALRRGQTVGAVRAGDPVLIARGILLAAHGFVLSAPTMTDAHVDGEALDAELRHLLETHLAP
jgi:AcrR family transcriptional regulator